MGEEPLCCYGSDGCGFRGGGEEPHRGIGTDGCPVQQLKILAKGGSGRTR